MNNQENFYELNELQVTYKPSFSLKDRPTINNSTRVVNLLRQIWEDGTIELYETFKAVFVASNLNVIGVMNIGIGGLDNTPVDLRRIFSAALLCNAQRIILAHNHPSGNVQPSPADREITNRIIEVGELMRIKVIDHIILTAESHLSFMDEGLI